MNTLNSVSKKSGAKQSVTKSRFIAIVAAILAARKLMGLRSASNPNGPLLLQVGANLDQRL